MPGLLRCAYFKINGTGYIRHLPDALHHGCQFPVPPAARPGGSRGRYMDKSLRLTGDLPDPLPGGGSDHGHQCHIVNFRSLFHLLFFLIGQIGNEDGSHLQFLTSGKKTLCSIMEHRVGISHKRQGNKRILPGAVPCLLPHPFHNIKHPIRGHPSLKRPDIGVLNHLSLCGGIGEGNTDLNQIRSGPFHLQYIFHRAMRRGISRRQKGDERLAVGCPKCPARLVFLCLTHVNPPPCIWRLPPRPYLPGPTGI